MKKEWDLRHIAETAKKFRIVTTSGNEYIAINGDYVWEDENEDFGCDGIIIDEIDGRLLQINSDEIKSIEVID